MLFLTNFADQAVVLPLTFAVALALVAAGWRRGALAWVTAILVTLAVILVGKLVVHACAGTLLSVSGLRSPSGHTASAAIAYGGLLALLAPQAWRPRLLAVLAAIVAAAVIGGTRLALGVHTRADVLVGAVVGIAGVMMLSRLAGERPPGVRLALPLAAAVGVVLLFHGEHLHAEGRIWHLSHLVWPLTVCLPPG
ncbi:Phosphatase PAP2 family protein [Rhodovastum atsumiense]|nr:phosphatase PAP2 family protein [Rhodovastum atsumiense]CAH2604189.1 Phosphatase PAP2 family protein [Rhodovastum atsumiense]